MSGDPATSPFFSVVISTYNRSEIVMRAVASCLRQTERDFEVVVVDDASPDDTVARLEALADPAVRVVRHDRNRGINPSRHTGVAHARGRWLVILDSDWELYPHSLARLRELIDALPEGVRVLRSRLLWDGGRVSPTFVPDGPIGYEERIAWAEEEGGWDAARCIHRDVFARTPYFADRRGGMEALYELELARNERSLYVDDILGMEHVDAPNSYLRDAGSGVASRMIAEAPDMLWMAETVVQRHGPALRAHGPRQYAEMERIAAQQAFLLGQRRRGIRHVGRAVRAGRLDLMLLGTTALGLLGPRAAVRGSVLYRQRTWR